MITLAIDSTMNGCCACLYDDKHGVLSAQTMKMSRGQAEHLIPLIDDIVTNYDDIDLIAVTKGPGAFTGMRIGLAAAKSLALALDIPVFGVCTFRAVLETYLSIKPDNKYDYYGVLLETKRKDYYFQMFDGKTMDKACEPMAMEEQDITSMIADKNILIIGDAADRFKNDISFYNINMPAPAEIARIAIKIYDKDKNNADCEPQYLRMPEIGTPKTLPRKLKQ